jgi:hypothetical protein
VNGCCPTNADGPSHGRECSWYWPCGCRKQRDKQGKVKPHTHRYAEGR